MKLDCRETLSRLGDLIDAEIDDKSRALVQAHLDDCPACERSRQELLRLKQLVRAKTRGPSLPAGLPQRIIAEIRRDSSRTLFRSRLQRAALAAAAAVLLVLAGWLIGPLLLQAPPTPIAHAEAMQTFSRFFETVDDACPPCRDDGKVLEEIRRQTGIALDAIPRVPGTRFFRWVRENIAGRPCVRLDYQDALRPAEDRRPDFSVFAMRLDAIEEPHEVIGAIEEGEFCECVAVKDLTLYCFRDSANALNLVSRMPRGELCQRLHGKGSGKASEREKPGR